MPITEIQKFEIIVKHNEGISIRNIANLLNLNKNTVSLWLSRYNKEKTLKRKPNCSSIRKKINNQ